MTYKFNGTTLSIKPSEAKWVQRKEYGVDMGAHSVYPAVREFEFRWGLLSMAEFQEIYGYYSQVSVTGTIVVELPRYAGGSWSFYAYSGCTLQEPEVGTFFEEHVEDVKLLVVNVRTN